MIAIALLPTFVVYVLKIVVVISIIFVVFCRSDMASQYKFHLYSNIFVATYSTEGTTENSAYRRYGIKITNHKQQMFQRKSQLIKGKETKNSAFFLILFCCLIIS